MLQFIFGRPAAGKTYTVLEKINELSLNNQKSVLIVPEQFTFESERAVLEKSGDRAALNVEVLSFTRLCDEVGRNVGSIAGKTLSDCDKVVFMKKALNAVAYELNFWGHYADSVSFSKTILDSIGELKINAVSPLDLRNIAEITDKPAFKLKLNDIALIYETYDALIGEKYIDPLDALTKLNMSLSQYNYFDGKTVFLDSFKGFTGQQYKIIERIFSQAKDVYISLTNDVSNVKEYNVYTNIRKTVDRIKEIAKKYKIPVAEPIILGESRYKYNGLHNLEALISGKADIDIESDASVNLCRAATPMDECEYAARTIKRLVREGGYRYRDFVIIVRDVEQYKDYIVSACRKNDISLFFDNRISLSGFPLAVAGQSAINALNFSTENILRFNKTGLGAISFDEISELENYAYIWNIDGEMWLKDFEMNPAGLTNNKEIDTDKLNYLNELRKKAINPLVNFKENFKNNAFYMAKALIKLFDDCNASEKLMEMGERFADNNTFLSDALKQSYEEYMRILDSIVNCFGDNSLSKNEFAETLSLAVSLSNIGVIPQTLDQVTFGSADRIRPSRPKVAFILGANQGVFPKTVQNSGILNIQERRYLIENGIKVSDNLIFSSIDEEYLVYCNICCPSEKLYISYFEQTVSGEKSEASTFVNKIKAKLSSEISQEPLKFLDTYNAPETEKAAFSEFCRRLRSDIPSAKSIKEALSNTDYEGHIKFIEDCFSGKTKNISANTAKELYGKNIVMSASRFDNFNRCHFSYFCRYGLKAQKLYAADFDVMQRGTIVHFVLERLILEHKNEISSITGDGLDILTDKYIDDYLDSISGLRNIMNARTRFLISRISRSLKEVVRHIAAEIGQSDFKPVACELKIGENKSFSFPYDDGRIYLNGSIDRVDEYNGYIRIIDYKTGSRSFKLPDILFGLNLQMLIYLYAVTRAKGLSDEVSAAILYQPSKRNTNDNNLAMNGLLQSDSNLYSAMDKGGNGEFIPKLSLNKDGSISKTVRSYIEKQNFTEIFDYIEILMRKTGNAITGGDIAVSPLDGRESPACKYCDFSAVCGIEDTEIPQVPDLKNDEIFEVMREAHNDGI